MSHRRMTRRSLMTFATIATSLLVLAGPAPAAMRQRLDLDLGLGTNYDSNLLQYSDQQRQVFLDGTHPERYSISSISDVTMTPSAALNWTLNQGGGRQHVLRVRVGGDAHARNATADYSEWSVRWREVLRRGRSLTLGYYRLPGYYLRQLQAEDVIVPPGGTNYRRAEFDLDIASAAWSQRLNRRTEIELDYQYEHRKYRADFPERESSTNQGDVALQLFAERPGTSVTLHGGYRDAAARASDGDEVGGVPDDDDISYAGPFGGVAGRYEFSRDGAQRWAGDARYDLGSRTFSSDRAFDTYHNGRHDLIQGFEVGLRYALRPHWAVRGWYRYEISDAQLGPGAPTTSVVGSYSQSLLGVGVSWSGSVWRSRSEPKAAPGN